MNWVYPRCGMTFRNPCSPHWQRGSHQHFAPRQRKNTPKTEMPTNPELSSLDGVPRRQGADRIPLVWCKPRGAAVAEPKFQKVLPFFSRAAWADLVADDQDTHCFIEYQWYYFGIKRAILLRSCRNVYIVVFSFFFDPGFLSNILTPQLQQAEALRHAEAFRVA